MTEIKKIEATQLAKALAEAYDEGVKEGKQYLHHQLQKARGEEHRKGYDLGVKNTLEWAELNCLAHKDIDRVLKEIKSEKANYPELDHPTLEDKE